MSAYRFCEVIRLQVPFTDGSGSKERPAIVVSSPRYNRERPEILIMPVTSKLKHADTYGTLKLEHWQNAGLEVPSVVKPQFFTLPAVRVTRRVGQLTRVDTDALCEVLAEILGRHI